MSRIRMIGVPIGTCVVGIAVGMGLMAWVSPRDQASLAGLDLSSQATAAEKDHAGVVESSESTTRPAEKKGAAENKGSIKSRKIQIGLSEYQLQFETGKLHLWTGGPQQELAGSSTPILFELHAGETISEMQLTKWLNTGLAGVLEVTRQQGQNRERDYFAIFLSGSRVAPSDGKPVEAVRVSRRKLLTTKEDYKILATNGDWGGDNFFAVVGKIEFPGSDFDQGIQGVPRVTSGAFYIDYCPFPPLGEVQEFRFDFPPVKN